MKKFYFYIIAVLCVLCSCHKTTYINPSKTTLTYPIQGGELLDTIHADGDWEVAICPEWVQVEIQDSVLKCVVGENQTGKKRNGKITLKGGDARQSISVSQSYICTHITPKSASLTFEKEGGMQTVGIDTDGSDINVDVSGNMTAKYDNGKLVVEAPANNAASTSGKIVLTCDSQMAQIDVVLKGTICSKCGGKGRLTCTKCGGAGYVWKENDDMTYGCSKCGGSGGGYPTEFYGSNANQYDLKKGLGQMICPVCNGMGS